MSIGDHPNTEITPLFPRGTTSRVRLSTRLFSPLGWAKHTEDFECIGVFRTIGSLLITPKWLETEEGEHPFEILLNFETTPSAEMVTPLREIPTVPVITAPNRIIRFTASWTKTKSQQLDLNLGVSVTKRLGWDLENKLPIYPAIWGPCLCLISQEEYLQAQTEDFTNGHLHN